MIAVFPALAALATLAACTDAPQPTGPARPGRPTLIQVATGPVVTSMADDGDGTCTDAGGGYYQLNWQAPKSYAGSCKTLQLNLSEGSPRTALFQFTK